MIYLLPRFLILLLCLSTSLLSGFRVMSESLAEDALERFRDAQTSRYQVELIRMVTVTAAGEAKTYRVLRLISQTETERYTHLRLLAPGTSVGHALLAHQRVGEYARLWHRDPGHGIREIAPDRMWEAFVDSPWSYADNIVDWTPASRPEARRPIPYRGMTVNVVDLHPFPRIKEIDTGYRVRRAHFSRENGEIISMEYFGPDGELIKVLEFMNYETILAGNRPMRAPSRMQMTHFQRHETAVLVYEGSRFDVQIDPAVFAPETFQNWTPEQETRFLKMVGVQEADAF